jgi:WhiB family transcriptional regulator, redox-sensing transcriptional regulator
VHERAYSYSPTVTSPHIRKELALIDWRETARCKEMDPDLFFPVGTTGPALLQIEAAKAVCRQCNCREECLQYALDSNQEYGIWGGMTEEERRYMRRELTARIAR